MWTKISSLLPVTDPMPVLFVGHGSPMNAIEDNRYSQSWSSLGWLFGKKWPEPKLIISISAHWRTIHTWSLTGMAYPRTIHDFGGFPKKLFDQQYCAPGAPNLAKALCHDLSKLLGPNQVTIDDQWGFDHGTWSVLIKMFSSEKIPVVQLSIPVDISPTVHINMGRYLSNLRRYGILVMGSGNVTHNLGRMDRGTRADKAYEWAFTFDAKVEDTLLRRDEGELVNFSNWGPESILSHPTDEHFLPLLYTFGASQDESQIRFFNTEFYGSSISMRSVIWG